MPVAEVERFLGLPDPCLYIAEVEASHASSMGRDLLAVLGDFQTGISTWRFHRNDMKARGRLRQWL